MEITTRLQTFIRQSTRHILVDAGVLLFIYLLPAFSHLLPFPLYVIEPMRIALFLGYLLSRNGYNAALLAFTLPLFSLWVSGHPPFFKALLISFELVINIGGFIWLYRRLRWAAFPALALSILFSKIAYYGMKFLFILFGLVDGSLISTGMQSQLLTLMGQALVFTVLYRAFFKPTA